MKTGTSYGNLDAIIVNAQQVRFKPHENGDKLRRIRRDRVGDPGQFQAP